VKPELGFHRQALHAQRLGLVHPDSGKPVQWEAPIPEDMRELIERLADASNVQPLCDGRAARSSR
jgi:hypothetical protein